MTTPSLTTMLERVRELDGKASKNWRAMQEGNQYIEVDCNQNHSLERKPGKLVGASRVDGLQRAWNPYWVGDYRRAENVSRFTEDDAAFIALSRTALPMLARVVYAQDEALYILFRDLSTLLAVVDTETNEALQANVMASIRNTLNNPKVRELSARIEQIFEGEMK